MSAESESRWSRRPSGSLPKRCWFHLRLDFACKARSYIAESSPATIIFWASGSTRRSKIGSRHSDSWPPDEPRPKHGSAFILHFSNSLTPSPRKKEGGQIGRASCRERE